MTTNKQTLESIEGLLRAITAHLGITPGGASTPEINPNDPLDEVLEEPSSVQCITNLGADVFNRLERVGRTRTIRNVLKELMRRETSVTNRTVLSEKTGKGYRIYLARPYRIDIPSSLPHTMFSTADFPLPGLVKPEAMKGWTVEGKAKVLDAFEINDEQYFICELL